MQRIIVASFLFLTAIQANGQVLSVKSPDGQIEVILENEADALTYRVDRLGQPVLLASRLGLEILDGDSMTGRLSVADTTTRSVDETWEQVWGETRFVRNHFNELRATFRTGGDNPRLFTVVFRVFDDGFGFRYDVPAQPNLGAFKIMDELSEFALAEDPKAWWIGAYQWNRYEYLYEESLLSEAADTLHTPLTMETRDGLFLSIHEAALTNYSSMTLERTGDNVLEANLIPWSDGVKVRTAAPMVSPWRTVQIADNAGDLITSYLILNLNEPNKIDDTSWIHPGKYVGIWWEMHLGISSWGSGPIHGATTENTKRYIDFAAANGFDGVLVEGWNVGWDGDWIKNGDQFQFAAAYPDFDLDALSEYAAKKGTRLIGHNETAGSVLNYESQLEAAFSNYEAHGVRAVKTGYVAYAREIRRKDEDGNDKYEMHHGQFMVEHYRRVVEAAAKHHIMIDAHEPIKPTGIRRTYPNMMTREGARGQEYNSPWGGGNGPDHTLILPFTRLLGGPMDFTPGIFQLVDADDEPANSVPTTLAKQLALYLTIYSPLQMAADLPRNYEEQPEAFQFIKDVPTNWQDTRVLAAQIGDYLTIARKDWDSDDWYLGSITDGLGRTLPTPLRFLDPDRKYVAEVYRDAADADWQQNPLGFVTNEVLVDATTTLILRLAPGGGTAIRFRPATAAERSDADLSRCDAFRTCTADYAPE